MLGISKESLLSVRREMKQMLSAEGYGVYTPMISSWDSLSTGQPVLRFELLPPAVILDLDTEVFPKPYKCDVAVDFDDMHHIEGFVWYHAQKFINEFLGNK